MTIETVARRAGLRFRPLRPEHYDFAIPLDRWQRPGVKALMRMLEEGGTVRGELEAEGFGTPQRG